MTQTVSIRFDKGFDLDTWLRFYHACDWNRDNTVHNLAVMRDHAYLIATAWKGESMVGTLTVLSDGLNYATIDDLVVHPAHRHQGIGSQMMHAALARLGAIDPSVIKLNAVPGVEPFYTRLGFEASNETAMYLRERPASDPS